MKLDDTGAAFFVEDVNEEDAPFPADLATSPLPSKNKIFNTAIVPDLPETLHEDLEEDCEFDDNRNLRKKRKKRRELMFTRSGSRQVPKDDMFDMDDIHDVDTDDEMLLSGKELTISELVDIIDPEPTAEPSRVSFSSGYHSDPEMIELKKSENYSSLMSKSVGSGLLESTDLENKISQTFSEPSILDTDSAGLTEDVSWKWGELPKHEDSHDNLKQVADQDNTNETKSWFSWTKQSKSSEETVGVYLDDIEQNPELLKKYIGEFKSETESVDPLDISTENTDNKTDDKPNVERVDSVLDCNENDKSNTGNKNIILSDFPKVIKYKNNE